MNGCLNATEKEVKLQKLDNIYEKQFYVGLYKRLSRDDNDGKKESESISNQDKILRQYVAELSKKEPQNRFIIVKDYTDDGYTGTNFNRPGFIEMINDIENEMINMVVVKDLTRLGRKTNEVLRYYQEYFPSKKVRFITATEDTIDTYYKEDDDFIPFKAVMSEQYPKETSRKIKAVKIAKAKQGLFQGNTAPYGYKKSPNNKNRLIVDSEVSTIIQEIFEKYSKGYTRTEIVKSLNERKIIPPREYLKIKGVQANSEGWKEITITRIVSNPVYIGTMVGAKTVKPSFRRKERIRNTKKNQIIVENMHEPIIDIETFKKCQMLKNKFKNNRKRKYDDIFKGLIYCKECGSISTLKHKEKLTKKGEKCEINSYICSEANKGTKKKCNNTKSISSKKLYNLIIPIIENQCKSVYFNDDDIKKVMNNLEKSINFECHRLEDEKQRLFAKIDKLNEQIKITYNDKLENIINNETFLSIKAQKENDIKNCKKQICNLEQKIEFDKNRYTIGYNQIKKLSEEFFNTSKVTKQMLNNLIDKIEIDSNHNINLKLVFSNINKN